MTKRNLTLGTASGKLGSTVYFRRRGQQIARVLVSSVNDNRTPAQRLQRAKFANYVAGWRLIRQYVEQSWRGVSRYGSPENAFYHHNRGFMPTATKGMSRAGYAFPPLGIVTYGALQVGFTLRGVGITTTTTPSGTFPVSVELDAALSAPTTLSQLAGIFTVSEVGVEVTDVIHILAYAYMYSSSPTDIVSVSESAAPRVYHLAASSQSGAATLAAVAPWLEVNAGTSSNNRRALGFRVKSSYLPDIPDVGDVGYVFAIYVERPSNPQYSRFSRARFIAPENVLNPLRNLCGNTPLAQAVANTYTL